MISLAPSLLWFSSPCSCFQGGGGRRKKEKECLIGKGASNCGSRCFCFPTVLFRCSLTTEFPGNCARNTGRLFQQFFPGSNTGAGSIWKSMCKKTHLLAYWTEPRHAMQKWYMKANVAHFGLNSKYKQGNPLPPPPSATGVL